MTITRAGLLSVWCLLSLVCCGTQKLPSSGSPVAPQLGASVTAPTRTPTNPKLLPYPESRRVAQIDTIFGVTIADPYRWLEDEKSTEVQQWMTAQDGLSRRFLHALPERQAIVERLAQLYYVDMLYAPRLRKNRIFYARRHATKEKAIVYWKEGKRGTERVLLDPNTWSADGSISLGNWTTSHDGKTVAYQVKQNNSDKAIVKVMDVSSGRVSEVDTIQGGRYATPSWTPRGDGFYYTYLPTDPSIEESERPGHADVRFHKLGTAPQKDRIVHPKTGNPSQFLQAALSYDGRFLLLNVHHGWTASDAYVMDMTKPVAKSHFVPLAQGGQYHYYVEAYRNNIYVHTDEGASRYRVMRVDRGNLERHAWTEVVPEQPEATLSGMSIIGGRLALQYMKNATSFIQIRELDGRPVRDVPLPGLGSVAGPVGVEDRDEAYFTFESFTQPVQVYETSIRTGRTSLYAQVKVPVKPEQFEEKQVFYRSKDGTRISMFIVARKGFKRDGTARVLLQGYGGFQVSETPYFSSRIYPWLERGGVFALPNLRGGGEYGEQWHRDGMLLKKQNVFDDFIAAAEYLIAEGYTRPERLAIRGASNGGLLMGAALTQRPELFRVALCGVPLLDMIRYHLFGSGKTWRSEYGSAEKPDQFRALASYSPYHHLKLKTRYPALLVLSADSDDRVDPMHARKFVAAIQAASSGGPVLLRIERQAGHGGADLIKATVQQVADEIAFGLAMTASTQRDQQGP